MPSSAASPRSRILPFYVMRNALVPQVTGLAMSLGAIFNGAIIVEQVFSYPGLGRLLIGAVYSADYSLVLGVTAISIIAVSAAVFLIDILYPLYRSARAARLSHAQNRPRSLPLQSRVRTRRRS